MSPSPEQARVWMRDGEAHVASLAERLGDDAFAAPSGLPGWTRGHVLTHIARNADGLRNLLAWAATGVETPMYASLEQRNADIDAGSARPPEELRADLVSTAKELGTAIDEFPSQASAVVVRMASGVEITAAEVPWMRARELWVHGVDLAAASGFEELPPELVDQLIEDVAPAIAAREGCPAAHLVATDRAVGVWLGDPEGAVEVTGPAADLCGWLLGRTDGEGLQAEGGELPQLPRWL